MQVVNIELEEDEDKIVSITYRDETTGLPVDLTGCSALMQLRPQFGDPTVILELTDTNGLISLGGTDGTVDITFRAIDTDMENNYAGWTQAAYDLVIIDTNNLRTKILKGFVTLARSSSLG